MNIQWYPGHMTKTRRMIAEQLKNVDAVCEILDARIPISSRNPDVDELTAGKPRLVVLNRVDQADPASTRRWADFFRARGYAVLETNAKGGAGTTRFAAAVRELLADKLRSYAEKGMAGRVVRVMILGIPNVGKSTFINQVAGRKTAKTEDRPGVTRSKQWVPIDKGLELLDTPGILWPKFEDQSVGLNLAYTGAVKDDILDVETLGCHLMAPSKENVFFEFLPICKSSITRVWHNILILSVIWTMNVSMMRRTILPMVSILKAIFSNWKMV